MGQLCYAVRCAHYIPRGEESREKLLLPNLEV